MKVFTPNKIGSLRTLSLFLSHATWFEMQLHSTRTRNCVSSQSGLIIDEAPCQKSSSAMFFGLVCVKYVSDLIQQLQFRARLPRHVLICFLLSLYRPVGPHLSHRSSLFVQVVEGKPCSRLLECLWRSVTDLNGDFSVPFVSFYSLYLPETRGTNPSPSESIIYLLIGHSSPPPLPIKKRFHSKCASF